MNFLLTHVKHLLMKENNLDLVKKVSFHTMGCRLNFSETGELIDGFTKRGYQIVEFGEAADVVFLNTCTVTDSADSTARNWIRRAVDSSPEGKIVVAGCFAQMEPEQVNSIAGVDLILGTSEKFKLFDYLDDEESLKIKIDHSQDFWGAATSLAEGHTRGFLKIQDGCNYICSFCIIPFARGRSRTISIAQAIEQAQKMLAQGFKEIVLTGVNIGEYERSSGEKLVDLVSALQKLPELKRLRLSSVEPNTITEELLLELSKGGIYQDHFHLPLQSGDDEILKLMRRKYTSTEYLEKLDLIKKYFPLASIGADIMVGFPGETEEQFQHTYDLLKNSAVTHFHVFPYSKRKGTTAAKLVDQVSEPMKKRRARLLLDLGEQKMQQLMEQSIGSVSEVLFEQDYSEEFAQGYTSNYLKILVPKLSKTQSYKNEIAKIRITEICNGLLKGEFLQ